MSSNKNVVLVVCDSLRAKNLEPYGYEGNETPFISRLAEEGTCVENYYSNASWTLPAHASIFSGKLPSEHGTHTGQLQFTDKNKLTKEFSQKGYDTYAVSENGLVSEKFGFSSFDKILNPNNRSGDVWREAWGNFESRKQKWLFFWKNVILEQDIRSVINLLTYSLEKLGLDIEGGEEDFNPTNSFETIESALELVKNSQREQSNFFLFVNLMPTHYPYTFNEAQKEQQLENLSKEEVMDLTRHDEFGDYIEQHGKISEQELESIENSYDASIQYTDTVLRHLEKQLPSDTHLVIVGDHGELIGEESCEGYPIWDHHFGTYEELIEVPLILSSNTVAFRGEFFDHTCLKDILLNLANGKKEIQGKEQTISEYHGRSRFNDSFGIEIPLKFQELYERESFTLLDSTLEYEITNRGETVQEINQKKSDLEYDISGLRSRLPFVLRSLLKERGYLPET